MKKRTLLLLALPLFWASACSQDKKPESNQEEALTEQAEGGDPHVRPQEYEHDTQDDQTDTIAPVNPDTVKAP
ncbi:MAG: hypothetical protein ACO1O1_02950 [Adhaeribacter sp.]